MSVRVGFIGVGGIAQAHMSALQKVDGAKIVAVYDVNEEAASEVAARLGAKTAATADELLDPNAIDAVFLCTPPFARGDLDEVAARRGIHLLAEKPLGLDLDEVRRKQQVITESGIIHSTGYCLRYYDTVQQAKEYLRDRSVHLIQAHRFGTSHPSKWWKQLHMSGGHLVDAVTHQVDLIRYMVGEIEQLDARFTHRNIKQLDPDATIYSAGALVFVTDAGAVGTLTESCVSSFHSGSDIKVFGEDFFILLSGNGKNLKIIDRDQNETIVSESSVMFEQDRAFIQAIESGDQSRVLCGYDEGVNTLAVTLQANALIEKK